MSVFEIRHADNGVVQIDLLTGQEIITPADMVREFPPATLWPRREIRLSGRAPLWLFAALGYQAAFHGAMSVRVFSRSQGEDGWVDVFGLNSSAPERVQPTVPWMRVSSDSTRRDAVRWHLLPASREHGDWSPEEVLSCLPDLEVQPASVTLTGAVANWMYTAAAIRLALSGVPHVFYDAPAERALISIGAAQFGQEMHRQAQSQDSLVVGVVGDPNAGKSVLSRSLEVLARSQWPDAWMYDSDMASPTMRWHIRMLTAGSPDEAKQLRNSFKRDWSPELEARVARQLQSLRHNLPLVIADLPGGIHPKSPASGTIPQRIPPGREVIMREIDVFVLLARSDRQETLAAWRTALAEHGLADRIGAELISDNPQYEGGIEFDIAQAEPILRGIVRGLDRNHLSPAGLASIDADKGAALIRMLRAWILAAKARAACSLSFLTKPGGTSYGAAVQSRDGRIFLSGQYSSFNHSTNVHAECGALLQATMAGSPDVDMLALASTDPVETARPCGVCRQVMAEHVARSEVDLDVVMINPKGGLEISSIAELLPYAWRLKDTNRTGPANTRRVGGAEPPLAKEAGAPRTGDHVVLQNGQVIALVWDPSWRPGELLVKLKYRREGGGWVKFSHSYTQPERYIREVQALRLPLAMVPVPGAIVASYQGVEGIYPALPVGTLLPEWLRACLDQAEIPETCVRVTGSRAIALNTEGSDLDVVIATTSSQVNCLRKQFATLLQEGKINCPAESESAQRIARLFPGGIRSLIRQCRYVETLAHGDTRISILYEPLTLDMAFDMHAGSAGRLSVSGKVIEAHSAPFKRSVFRLRPDGRSRWFTGRRQRPRPAGSSTGGSPTAR